jgi:hypothetical protein
VLHTDGSSARCTIHPPASERRKTDVLVVAWFFDEYCKNGCCVDYKEELTWPSCDSLAFAMKAVSARPHVVIGGSARAFQIRCRDGSYDKLIAQARDRFTQHGITTSTGDLYFSRFPKKDQYHLQSSPEAKQAMATWLNSIDSDMMHAFPPPRNVHAPELRQRLPPVPPTEPPPGAPLPHVNACGARNHGSLPCARPAQTGPASSPCLTRHRGACSAFTTARTTVSRTTTALPPARHLVHRC